MTTKDERLYGKFTLDFPEHPKIAILSDAAFRCLVEATLWSRKQERDGLLARRYALARWSADVLQELCNNDDEKPSFIEVENGWLIHDYAEHQDTKAEIEARRERNRIAGQKGGLAKAKRGAKRNGKQPASDSVSETLSRERVREREISRGGYVTGERHQATATATPPAPQINPDNNDQPPRWCARHLPGGTLDPCGACAETRKGHDRWLAQQDLETKERIQREGRELAQQRQAEYDAAHDAIDACQLCDSDGYTPTNRVCDHVDHGAETVNGRAAARAALAAIGKRA